MTLLSHPVEDYVRELAAKAQAIRLPRLFHDAHPQALYQHINRNGVSAIAIAQRHLPDAVVEDLLRFRLANAILYDHIRAEPVYERGAECEWWYTGSPDDILLFAGSAETGEIGAHSAFAFLPDAQRGMTLRTADRPLFEAEQMYDWTVFHRLPLVPDLPLTRIVEPRRLVKAYWLDPLSELAFRAPAELGVASFHATAGPLRDCVDVILGEITREAERNLDFFGTTFVTFSADPGGAEPPIFHQPSKHIPTSLWAMLTHETYTSAGRVGQVQTALDMPGQACLQELVRLGANAPRNRSRVLQPR